MACVYTKASFIEQLRQFGFEGRVVGPYMNSYTEVIFVCEAGHKFKRRPDKALHAIKHNATKTVCPECNKHKADRAQTLTHREYYKRISPIKPLDTYVNAYTEIMHKCRNNHVFSATPASLMQAAHCPMCLTDWQMSVFKKHRSAMHTIVGGIRISNPTRGKRRATGVTCDHRCLKCKHTWTGALKTDQVTICHKCGNGRYGRKEVIIDGRKFYVRGFEPQTLKVMQDVGIDMQDIVDDNSKDMPVFKTPVGKYTPDFYVARRKLIVECKSAVTLGLICAVNVADRARRQHNIMTKVKEKAKHVVLMGYNYKLVLFKDRDHQLRVPKNWMYLSNQQLVSKINGLNGTKFVFKR